MLEEGVWDGLPAEVFVRGFVTSYARCVGLPADEAKQRFTDVVHRDEVVVEPEVEEPAEKRPRHRVLEVGGRRKFGLALLVIIVFIIATITLSLLWQRGAGAEAQASLDPPTPTSSQLFKG